MKSKVYFYNMRGRKASESISNAIINPIYVDKVEELGMGSREYELIY